MATHPHGKSNQVKTRNGRGKSSKRYLLSNADELNCDALNRAANNMHLIYFFIKFKMRMKKKSLYSNKDRFNTNM